MLFDKRGREQERLTLPIFPELKPSESTGYRSDVFSKWFGRFLKNTGADAPMTSFHSLRHNFNDALRDADVPLDVREALGGWSRSGSAESIYGRGYKPNLLRPYVDKVSYPDLDLSHLYEG